MLASCPMKISLVSSSRPQSPDQLFSRHASDASVCPRTSDSSAAPVADFDYPPESSSCLDNSAAKHKLLVKPRNQRSSKMRRLSSVIGLLPPCRRRRGRPGSTPPHSLPPRPLSSQGHVPFLRNPRGQWDHLQELGLLLFFSIRQIVPSLHKHAIRSLVLQHFPQSRDVLRVPCHPTALRVGSTYRAWNSQALPTSQASSYSLSFSQHTLASTVVSGPRP